MDSLTPISILREIVAIPSVNPAFLPPGHPLAGEARVADWIADEARRMGLDVQFQRITSDRSNLLISLKPQSVGSRWRPKHRLILAPHLDTVGLPEGMERAGVEVRKGKLYGRGACDTKGSVAAMFYALCYLSRNPSLGPRQTEILFVGLADEESQQLGSRFFAKKGPKADLAIVGEPTQNQVVTAHKGNVWFKLQTRGKAAHGARPELGVNAINGMSEILQALERDYQAMLKTRLHPLLGHPTLNVGTIEGGVQANIVPDVCTISLDRRTLPGETRESVFREVRGFMRVRGLKGNILPHRDVPCLPLETNSKQAWVEALMEMGGQKNPLGVDYYCDASVLAEGGIPSVVMGPGNIAQAHTVDEWISLTSLDRCSQLLIRFICSLP